MTRILVGCVVLIGALMQGQSCPDCPDPSRPWRRGSQEKSCALPHEVARLRRENPAKTILACECQHTCDPDGELAGETDGRGWDYRCEARCATTSCTCPHPCES